MPIYEVHRINARAHRKGVRISDGSEFRGPSWRAVHALKVGETARGGWRSAGIAKIVRVA